MYMVCWNTIHENFLVATLVNQMSHQAVFIGYLRLQTYSNSWNDIRFRSLASTFKIYSSPSQEPRSPPVWHQDRSGWSRRQRLPLTSCTPQGLWFSVPWLQRLFPGTSLVHTAEMILDLSSCVSSVFLSEKACLSGGEPWVSPQHPVSWVWW